MRTILNKEDLPMVTIAPVVTYVPNQLYKVPLAALEPDPRQPRKYIDPQALDELAASISQMGIIEPIVCRQDPATKLVYVVAGERRCAAARKSGVAEVPAIFIDGSNYAEIALVENLLRQDLNPVEEAEALQRLMDDHAYRQEQLATVIGKSQATISLSLSLNRLPKEIRDACRQDPTVPRNVLVEIARKKQERGMLTAFRKYREQQAKIAAKLNGDDAAPGPRKRTKAEVVANNIGIMVSRIGGLAFPSFSADERAMLIESMTSLRDTLDAAITRAGESKKKTGMNARKRRRKAKPK
jgi:ParB family transcriptional regulator, chromosome partitioning protein